MSCLISFERCQSSCEEHGTSEHHQNNLAHGRIWTTNTASRLQVHRSHHSASSRLVWHWIKCPCNLYIDIIRSINKHVNLCMYTRLTWCTYVLPLQPYRDMASVLIWRLINVDISLLLFTIFICYKRNSDNWHIVDVIYTHLHVVALPSWPVTVI